MIKNIIILILSVLCVLSSIQAYRQNERADENASFASKSALGSDLLKEALKACQMEAERWHEIAMENERKAIECLQSK